MVNICNNYHLKGRASEKNYKVKMNYKLSLAITLAACNAIELGLELETQIEVGCDKSWHKEEGCMNNEADTYY